MALLKDKSPPYALHWDDDESMLLSVARLVTIIESDAPANTLRQEASNCELEALARLLRAIPHVTMAQATSSHDSGRS
jgi:hypothetical protein